jgi:hypothetical protein
MEEIANFTECRASFSSHLENTLCLTRVFLLTIPSKWFKSRIRSSKRISINLSIMGRIGKWGGFNIHSNCVFMNICVFIKDFNFYKKTSFGFSFDFSKSGQK